MRTTSFPSPLLLTLLALGASTIAVGQEVRVVTKRISKEEIAAASSPKFIKPRSLSDVLSDKIKLLATTLTERHGGTNRKLIDLLTPSAQLTHEAHMNRLAILHYQETGPVAVNADGVRLHLLGQTRKSTEVKFKEAFPIVEEIRKGISFKWSPGSKSTSMVTSVVLPKIRYGLIAKDILPGEAPAVASLGTMSDVGYEYSRPATVVYTIDKLEDDAASATVFSAYSETNPEIGTPKSTAEQVYRRPSTDIAFKIEASNGEDSVSDKVGAGALPGAKITMAQSDGLVGMEVITTGQLRKDKITYDTRLPLYGEASLTRKYDEKFQVIQTSAVNLLGKPSAPKLHIHHLAKEEKFQGELVAKHLTTEWGVALEPRKGWAPGRNVGEAGDKITIRLVNSF